ncbi:MAG TPA: polysaccharide deacetylase family protein [Longimicrobium sp.]|nr:polysaccharide deacetylase family protein [Longimicrobium sp.]
MHRIAIRPRRAWRGPFVLALVTAAACAPAIRPALHAPCGRGGCAAGGIPVLAWHGFADQAGREQGSLTESFQGFEEMLAFLSAHGFRSVFPSDVRRGGAGRQVILTFDDGRKEQLRAAEMLERHGFRGIFFVIPNRTRAGDPRFLDAADLERLARAGHRVAAHGYDHRSLPGSGTEVAASLVRSPGMLGDGARRWAGEDFAFPFGHYTAEIAEAVSRRYRWLHTVNPGYWDGASALVPRMLIMTGVDPALFRAYVLGGGSYRPALRPLTPDGAVAGRVAFLSMGAPVPDGLELFAITADAAGESYVSRPLGDLAQVAGDTLWVDLAGYMRRHYPPGRMVISYAVMRREGGELRYASPGVLHWTADPVTGPRAIPQRRDTIPPPGRR